MFTYGMDCVRRTPDSYSHTLLPPTPPTPPKKSLGDELKGSFDTIVIGKIESDVVDTPTFTGPYGQKLPVAPTMLVVGQNGAQVQQGGPSLFGTIANGIKWFFADAVPIIAKSEPVQEAAHKVVDFTKSAAKTTAEFAMSSAITVAQVVVSTTKAIEDAATSAWNWIKSWF